MKKQVREKGVSCGVKMDGTRTVFAPGRDIVASVVERYKEEVWSLIEAGTRDLVIDLDGVEMIDSAGLGLLAEAHKSLHGNGGKLIVVNASEDICDLVRALGFDRRFEVKPAHA